MKKSIFTFLMSVASLLLFAQSQPVTWSGAAGNDPAHKTPPQTLPADAPQSAPSDPLLWSQLPGCTDLSSSEIISAYNFETNSADDFIFVTGKNITSAKWFFGFWGGPYTSFSSWKITIYDDVNCLPGNILQQWTIPFSMSNEFQQCATYYFSYWADLIPSFTAAANTRYWISVQASDHVFPGQWGWDMHATVTGCEGAFKSAYFGFPDYVPAGGLVFTYPTDFAFELYGTGTVIPETPISNWALFIGIGLILIFAIVRFRRLI